MRASLYLFGFAAASIVGAGAVEIGCSSSSTTPVTPAGDDAAVDTGTTPPVDAGTPEDTATGCKPITTMSVATLSVPNTPGQTSWTCLEGLCKTSLTACGADCTCNNDVITALLCTGDGGVAETCFGPLLSSPNANDIATLTCLSGNTVNCAVGPDGGIETVSDAGHTEAGPTEAGPVDAAGGG